MACPVKKELINKKKENREKEERERKSKPYNEVIKQTVKETQMKTTPTQIVLGTEYSYLITTCIIHAHFVNLARPGSYETELNKLLKANGLPSIKIPSEVPSEELFGARIPEGVKKAHSMESVRSQASGYQEEGYREMMGMVSDRDPRKTSKMDMESIYSLTSRDAATEGEGAAQEEQMMMEEDKGAREQKEMKSQPKERREWKIQEIDAKKLGLKIYTSETNRFTKPTTYEDIIEGIKKGKHKITYTDKRSENEILSLIEKRKLKIEEDDLSVVSDEVFRKIRQGKELTPPSKIQKKPWQK